MLFLIFCWEVADRLSRKKSMMSCIRQGERDVNLAQIWTFIRDYRDIDNCRWLNLVYGDFAATEWIMENWTQLERSRELWDPDIDDEYVGFVMKYMMAYVLVLGESVSRETTRYL